MADDALVTIIVVAWNSRRFLARQLAALAAQSERRWRLVLVDNASRQDERPQLEDLPAGARLIQSEDNLGFAAANNLAAGDADTPFLALLNPDAFPAPDWLAQLLSAADRWPKAAAIGSLQVLDEDPSLLDGAGDAMHALGLPYRTLHRRAAQFVPDEGPTFSACGAAMLIRTARFREVGGFDPRFFCYCEDVDLGFRLRLAGHEIVQAPRAVVRHVAGGSGDQAFADFHGARNRLWTFVKCMPAPLALALFAPHLIASIVVALAHLRDGRWAAQLAGLGAGLSALPDAIAARRAVQRTRTVSSAQIARALTWSPFALLRREANAPL